MVSYDRVRQFCRFLIESDSQLGFEIGTPPAAVIVLDHSQLLLIVSEISQLLSIVPHRPEPR
jgi:hypothetical protein